MQEIREVDTLKTMVDTNAMTVVVFTMPSCGVCTPLKQKNSLCARGVSRGGAWVG